MEVLCAIRFPTLSLDLMVPQPKKRRQKSTKSWEPHKNR